MQSRRDFIRAAAMAGVACSAGRSASAGWWPFGGAEGSPMHGYAAPAIPHIRLGVVGVGGRGTGVIERVGFLPGITVTAICDNVPAKIDAAQKLIAGAGRPKAKEYLGDEAWKRLCEDPDVDVVYNTTPWSLHVPVALGAMRGGKHVFTEVPSAFTVDECWELVETSEKTKRHCMQLENCCYNEIELLILNLARLGMLGELVHAEGAYVHDLRWMSKTEWPNPECWRFDHNTVHAGNQYPTHGLVPLCLAMGINRGDRLDYLVSLDSKQANFRAYMEANLPPDHPRRKMPLAMADMNQSLIRTVDGKSILLQHDVSTPRPYTRIQFLSGTKGAVTDWPYRVGFEEKSGSGVHHWYEYKEGWVIREKYMHPLFKTLRKLAKKVGGHGGMDFIMDARWIYCLRFGLPLDTDVYDLATTCCLCELTETSARNRSRSCDIPDFTRGGWKTNPPMEIVDVDLVKMGVDEASFGDKRTTSQMEI